MKEHPFSIWTLRGIPGGDTSSRPAPGDIESWGATWKTASYDYLIGVCARAFGQDAETASMPAFIESQRRLAVAIDDFNKASTAQTTELINLSKEAGRQATTMIHLTWAITALTVILGIIAGIQLWAMLVKRA